VEQVDEVAHGAGRLLHRLSLKRSALEVEHLVLCGSGCSGALFDWARAERLHALLPLRAVVQLRERGGVPLLCRSLRPDDVNKRCCERERHSRVKQW